jgi:hypothetical protein
MSEIRADRQNTLEDSFFIARTTVHFHDGSSCGCDWSSRVVPNRVAFVTFQHNGHMCGGGKDVRRRLILRPVEQ